MVIDSSHLTSDFIQAQKDILLSKKESLLKMIKEVRSDDPFLDEEHVNVDSAVDTDIREQLDHDSVEAQVDLLKRELEDVELALLKIEQGRYGYCEKTDIPIPFARLKLIPEARFVVEK